VLSALYLASDHLPVQADLRIAGNLTTSLKENKNSSVLRLEFRDGSLFSDQFFENEEAALRVFDIQGKEVLTATVICGKGGKITLPSLAADGLKLVRIVRKNGQAGIIRLLGH
jgi:hypothetical protein